VITMTNAVLAFVVVGTVTVALVVTLLALIEWTNGRMIK